MLGKRETNSFQNTICIQSQRQRIYGQIIYIKLCKNPLDRLFEKGNGGGAKGRKEGKSRKWEFHPEGCICAILRYNTKMEGYTHCRYNTKWELFMQ